MPNRVAVLGAGLAGLSAALTALEAGSQVSLFEKAAVVGGATLLSGGLIWTFADLDEFQQTVPNGNPALQQLVFDSITDSRKWLSDLGVRFTTAEATADCAHAGWATATGEAGIRGVGQQMEPSQTIGALRARFEALGGQLQLESALDALIVDGARVSGARIARADGGVDEVRADAVILATGGFQGNPELLTRYVVGSPGNLYLRSNAWSTGDALTAALSVGAATSTGLDTFYGHAMIAPPASFRMIQFGEVTQGYGQAAVALNLAGRRFADESEGTGEEILNQRLARQPEGKGYYIVDQALANMARDPGKPVTQVVIDRARSRGGRVIEADSLEQLSESLGVPAEAAMATFRNYDRVCAADGRATGSRGGPGRQRFRFPLQQPPFYAVEVKASITSTLGGLAVDDHLRVLRRSASSSPIAQSISDLADFRETPIAGLFAVGGDIGGVSHFTYAGGLATALTTGRAAGRWAAV